MTNNKTILVIEDDKSLNRIISLKLEDSGFNVLLAENAEKAFEFLKDAKPDLIWLDIYLPGMDGFDFLKALRENPDTKEIKVVIVSVSGSNRKAEMAEKLGVKDYFVKSNYRIEELIEEVSKIIDRK